MKMKLTNKVSVQVFWFLTVCCILLNLESAFAQTGDDDLDTISIEIVKPYEPTISDAYKINDNPKIQDTVPFVPKLTYSLRPDMIKTFFDVEPIKPARIRGEPLDKLYGNYVKFGLGTYMTPYAEVFVNNRRSRKNAIGLHYKHLSSTGEIKWDDVGYNGYSDNELNLYGKKFLKKHTLLGEALYKRNVMHYYGFDAGNSLIANLHDSIIGTDAIKQKYSLIGGNVRLASHFTDSAKVNHIIGINYYNLQDLYGLQEDNLVLALQLSSYWGKEYIKLNASIDYNANGYYTDADTASYLQNTIFHIGPTIRTSGKKYKFSIGLNTYVEVGESVNFHPYPAIDFSYNFVGNIFIGYSGIGGMLERVNFKSLSDNNPFIVSDPELENENHKLLFYFGFKGALSPSTSFNVSLNVDKIIKMPFFITDTTGILDNKFTLVYDEVELISVHAELMHQKSDKLKLMLTGDYFDYSMDKELKPWHKPTFKADVSCTYNLKDKIIIKADVFVIGSQYYRAYQTDTATGKVTITPETLDGLVDVNLSLEYRYTKKLSAFINFNNIAASRYYKWNRYPLQRFSVLGGFTYGF